MKNVELVFCDAGGGHRSAANALREIARREERPWAMQMTNLLDLFAELDVWRKVTGTRGEHAFNVMLRRGWTLGSPLMLRVLHAAIRRSHRSQVERLERHWQQNRPDIVVSLIPHFNRALHEAMQRIIPDVPLVTILTDLADYPPHFWIEEHQAQYFICGTDLATNQALRAGHPAERVFQTSGMILNPRFYDQTADRKTSDIIALGLDPRLPIAIMMFGGEGSRAMRTIAQLLDASGLGVQLIAVSGKNTSLETSLRATRRRLPMYVTGFTPDVARLMRLSDLFIGKAGPGSISEAVAMGLPVIIERNAWTLPQERYNAEWVTEHGFGIAVRSFRRDIVTAITEMLDVRQRRQYGERVNAHQNRAVFEVPRILEQILSG